MKINGHVYPLYDDAREQEKHYDYWLARDLETTLKGRDFREEDNFEQGELELEEVE